MFVKFLVSEMRKFNLPGRFFNRAIFSLLFVSFSSFLCAQNPSGTLRGEVQDASAARVRGAQIVVQSAGSSVTRADDGKWAGRIRALRDCCRDLIASPCPPQDFLTPRPMLTLR